VGIGDYGLPNPQRESTETLSENYSFNELRKQTKRLSRTSSAESRTGDKFSEINLAAIVPRVDRRSIAVAVVLKLSMFLQAGHEKPLRKTTYP